MSEQWWWILAVLTPVTVLVGMFYLHVERQARLLKTEVSRIPGGLRFTAHGWSVEVHRESQQLRVQTLHGHHSRQPLDGGAQDTKEGAMTVQLPAPGLQIALQPVVQEAAGQDAQPTGLYTVVFNASDETGFALAEKTGGDRHVLRVEQVPSMVAASFQQFSGQIRLWVERLDRNIAAQMRLREQQAAAEEEARARAEARAKKAAAQPVVENLTPAEQIARWREVAGFSGTSEVGYNENGTLEWFIDLDGRGRVTLHADRRTLHTTLMGATVSTLGAELELSVRDELWTERDHKLQTFRLFRGASSEVRRAWKERIEILCDKLRSGEITPP